MVMKRQSFYSANQFTPQVQGEVDWLIGLDDIPAGSRLERTWVDVRFNQFGTGTLPPEFTNVTGPILWGVCLFDDSHASPGTSADDNTADWLWREMVAWDAPAVGPDTLTPEHTWVRASTGATGLRDSKGRRDRDFSNCYVHFCWNTPGLFGNSPIGVLYEVFIHQLWQTF